MPSIDPKTWASLVLPQIRNVTADELIRALERDGWDEEERRGATRRFIEDGDRVVIHYHPQKTYGPRLLKGLIADTGWGVPDLKRLKLIKRT